MCHKNKNEIVDYYYNLDDSKKREKTKKHLDTCNECKLYLELLVETGEFLDGVDTEHPLENTLKIIESKIEEVPQTKIIKQNKLDSIPVLKIAITILFILLGLYFLQSKMEFFYFWNNIENSWLVKTFGKYSFIMILFFSIGSLVTLALAPILYIQSNKGRKVILK